MEYKTRLLIPRLFGLVSNHRPTRRSQTWTRACRAMVSHHQNGSGVRNQPQNGNPVIAAAAGGKSRWMSGVTEATGRTDKVPIHVVHRGESTRPEDDSWNRGMPLLSSYCIFAEWNCFHRQRTGQSSKGGQHINASRLGMPQGRQLRHWQEVGGGRPWRLVGNWRVWKGRTTREEAKVWDQIGVW
jgi:hypothetical protein